MYCFAHSAVSLRATQHSVPAATSSLSLRQSGFRVVSRPHRQLPTSPIHYVTQRSNRTRPPPSIWMKTEPSSTSLATRIGAVLVVAGIVITGLLPFVGVFKNATSDSGDSVVDYQLSKVPIFTVTDATGRPFLAETDDHRLRVGYFFIQPADAQRYLERVKADNNDAKVLTIGLNEAFKFLDTRATPAKSVPERFDLFPDEHEVQIAEEVTAGAFQKAFGRSGVPIFYVDGLGIKDSKEEATVFPLFFEKEKLDETIETLKKQDPKATVDLKDMQVIDLKQTIKEIRAGGNPKLNRVVFVPLTESLKVMNGQPAE